MFKSSPSQFMTTIYSMEYSQADDDAGNGELNGELNGEFNSAQKATLNYIKENAGCNATEISDKTGVPFSTIDKHIRVLLKNGKIERRGCKKSVGYHNTMCLKRWIYRSQ